MSRCGQKYLLPEGGNFPVRCVGRKKGGRAYAGVYRKERRQNCAALLLCHRELKELIVALSGFVRSHNIKNNEAKTKLGVTHLYFIDYGQTGKESKDDVAFYVDLDR